MVSDIIGILAVSAMLVVVITTLMSFFILNKQMTELHLSLNSRMDQLLKSTGQLARAEGFQAGQQSQGEADKGR